MKVWFSNLQSRWSKGVKRTPRKPTQIRVGLFQNFSFKFILNRLQTYVVVLTLDTHNPCNRRYFQHIPLCLSTIQVKVLKFGIHNLNHKKVLFSYTILFPDVLTFPDIINSFWIPVTSFRNIESYLECNKESAFRESSILNKYSKAFKVNNR